jgi:hypothetical protein
MKVAFVVTAATLATVAGPLANGFLEAQPRANAAVRRDNPVEPCACEPASVDDTGTRPPAEAVMSRPRAAMAIGPCLPLLPTR